MHQINSLCTQVHARTHVRRPDISFQVVALAELVVGLAKVKPSLFEPRLTQRLSWGLRV